MSETKYSSLKSRCLIFMSSVKKNSHQQELLVSYPCQYISQRNILDQISDFQQAGLIVILVLAISVGIMFIVKVYVSQMQHLFFLLIVIFFNRDELKQGLSLAGFRVSSLCILE